MYIQGNEIIDSILAQRTFKIDINKIIINTAIGLLRKFALRRNLELDVEGNQKKMYLQCVKCSRHHRISVHHRNDMLIIPRKTYRDGKLVEYDTAYCYQHGCAQNYKSHKNRVGTINHY